jgi:hypothetical protein
MLGWDDDEETDQKIKNMKIQKNQHNQSQINKPSQISIQQSSTHTGGQKIQSSYVSSWSEENSRKLQNSIMSV